MVLDVFEGCIGPAIIPIVQYKVLDRMAFRSIMDAAGT
jgi:hypothetical protein